MLARLLSEGTEVLLMTDPVDEYVVGHMKHYGGVPLQSVTTYRGGGGQEEEDEGGQEDMTKLASFASEVLSGKVGRVAVMVPTRTRPASAPPACLVVDAANKTRTGRTGTIRRSQLGLASTTPRGDRPVAAEGIMDEESQAFKILQLNPKHPIIRELARRIGSSKKMGGGGGDGRKVDRQAVQLLFVTAHLLSGVAMDEYLRYQEQVVKMASQFLFK